MHISIKAGRILTLNQKFDVIKNAIVTIDEDILIANYLGCCELIDSGITCVADFDGFSPLNQVIEKTGLRATLNFGFMDKFLDEEGTAHSAAEPATARNPRTRGSPPTRV